jgi:hypothetical protein
LSSPAPDSSLSPAAAASAPASAGAAGTPATSGAATGPAVIYLATSEQASSTGDRVALTAQASAGPGAVRLRLIRP